jgi:ABC-type branched-subunit amino acid transport system ATPase component
MLIWAARRSDPDRRIAGAVNLNAVPIVLEVQDLVAGYSADVDVLTGVSIRVLAGEVVTVVGPNGAGKSTLMKAMIGLVNPRKGRVLLHNTNITGRRPHEIVRLGVGYAPQRENVFENMSVIENLELGSIGQRGSGVTARIEELLVLFPRLGERKRQIVGTMSGGERQMVAMARALMSKPEILLLDEPSAGLAPMFVQAMFQQVSEINAAGISILMVEQNARAALALSHRGYVLDLGRNAFEGPGRQLLDDPRLAELYLA